MLWEAFVNRCSSGKVFLIFFVQISQESTCVGVSFYRRSHPEVIYKKGALRNSAEFTGKQLCQSFFFNKVYNFFKKETLAQVLSYEFYKISMNTFPYRTPPVVASVFNYIKKKIQQLLTFKNNFFREHPRWLLLKFSYQ